MSDSQQPEPKTSVEKLRTIRQEFAASANKHLAELDSQIVEAEKLERQQRLDADFKLFMPGDDKAVLQNRDFTFLINNTKGATKGEHGPGTLIGATVAAAHKVHATVVGVDGVTVTAKFWGDKYLMPVHLEKGPNAYDVHPAEAKDFLTAAKQLLSDNTPDNLSDRQKHYIIVCDGAITGDPAAAASILEAAAKFNPKATFDFVVCSGTATGGIDDLVKKWSEIASGQKPNLVKVAAPAEINGAVMGIIRARLSGTAYVQPQAVVKAAVQPTPSV